MSEPKMTSYEKLKQADARAQAILAQCRVVCGRADSMLSDAIDHASAARTKLRCYEIRHKLNVEASHGDDKP